MEVGIIRIQQVYKNTNKVIISVLLFSLLFVTFSINAVSADSSVIYVSDSGGNDNWDGQSVIYDSTSGSGPKLSIKNATGTVNNGGTVNIADGTYTGDKNTKITISKDMKIVGQSKTGTVINGTDSAWIFYIQSGATVTIENLTLANGNADNGGAVYNDGSLTVNNSIFTGNYVDSIDYSDDPVTGFGGAIYNNGVLIVDNSNFTSNVASYGGGAIHNNGDLTVTGSNFDDNYVIQTGYGGGAISNMGILTVTGSTFTDNNAYACGGAIYSDDALTVTDSYYMGNQAYAAGGAIYNFGTLAVTGSSFTDNAAYGVGDPVYIPIAGGAIYNDYGGIYTLDSCQFAGNSPQDIYNNTDPYSGTDYGSGIMDPLENSDATVKAASKTTKSIGLQKTGLPFNYLILAILMVIGSLVPRRK